MENGFDPAYGELMECPFCHERPILETQQLHGDREPDSWYVLRCKEPGGLSTARYETMSDAQFHWNQLVSNIRTQRMRLRQKRER